MVRFLRSLLATAWELTRRKRDVLHENLEGDEAYRFILRGKSRERGVSAMLRVKNEERKIFHCLLSIIDVFDEVVLVDNASTDSTLEVVQRFKRLHDPGDKVRIHSYPFSIARCGQEHANTPENSVHNLAYYYNWCLSRCRYSYVFKWDADMILQKQGEWQLAGLLRGLSPLLPTLVWTPVQTVYRAPDGRWFLGRGEVYREERIFPNNSSFYYTKRKHWERLKWPAPVMKREWSETVIYEIKDTTEDEFSHWSSTTSFPTPRKRREWQSFNAVLSGNPSGEEFVEIASPLGDLEQAAAAVP